MRPARPAALAILAVTALFVSSCGSGGGAETSGAAGGASGGDGAVDYPHTVENCGEGVTFDQAPERVVLLETAPVTILDGLGVLNRAVARAGDFPAEYYDDDLNERIDGIDSLSEDLDASGHLAISQEAVVAQSPDLVLGQPDGVDRGSLASAGSNLLIQEVYCPDSAMNATYETLYDEIGTYGEIFDRGEAADELVAQLRERVDAVADRSQGEDRTAAVLYPTVGGGTTYAYGNRSMAQPQLEMAGFENVYDDVDERVFDVQIEDLVDRDPDVLILLYQGEAEGVEQAVTELPGAETITAVRNGDIHTQLFNFTEPATPLAVDGLERISERFQGD